MRTVDAEMRSYFSQVSQTLQKEDSFETDEDKEILVSNVIAEMKGKELELAVDKRCGKVVERIISLSNPIQLSKYLAEIKKPFSPDDGETRSKWSQQVEMMFNCNGSHIIQTAIEMMPSHMEKERSFRKDNATDDDNQLPTLDTLLIDLCKELFVNTEEGEGEPQNSKNENSDESLFATILYQAVSDRYASHVLKAILLTLNGQTLETINAAKFSETESEIHKRKPIPVSSMNASTIPKKKVPQSFHVMSKRLLHAISQFDLQNLVFNSFANPLTQLAVEVAENKKPIIEKALAVDPNDKTKSSTQVNSLMRDRIGSRFIEKVFQTAPEMWTNLYTDYFRHHMLELALTPVAVFTVQTCIKSTTSTPQIEMIFDEMNPHLKMLLEKGQIGVIASLIEACAKHNSRQKQLTKTLFDILGASNKEKNVVLTILSLRADRTPFSPMGSQTLQSLFKLQLEFIMPAIEGMLALDAATLKKMCCDFPGSKVIEEFLKVPGMKPGQKQVVIDRLRGNWAELASDKYGSHIVEKCYQVAEISRKETIVAELTKAEKQLATSTYGRFALRNCRVDKFKKKDEWVEKEVSNEKKRKMFSDILGDAPSASQPAKKQTVAADDTTMQLLGIDKKKVKKEEQPKQKEVDADELDDLFDSSAPKKPSSSSTKTSSKPKEKKAKKNNTASKDDEDDPTMSAILSAITKTKK